MFLSQTRFQIHPVALWSLLFVTGCDGVAQETTGSRPQTSRADANHSARSSVDWAQFRGPGGMGKASMTSPLPEEWTDDVIQWKTPLPGAGTSSPVTHGDRIYVTCYSGHGVPGNRSGSLDQLLLKLVCLRRSTGSVQWTKEIRPELPEQETIRDQHGYSSSTPAVDENGVYAFFGKTGVFAFDHNGTEKWRADVGSQINGWGTAASVVLFEDLVIVNASVESESLVALDRRTGKEVWRSGGIREAWNTPLLMANSAGAPELIVPIFGTVLSFDPKTGKKLWRCDTDIKWYMVPSAVSDSGIVYCIGGRSGDGLAIRSGGIGDVTSTHVLWRINKGSNVSSPIFHDGHLYWIHDQRGIAYCVNAESGEMVYEERLPRIGQVYASPILADGKIFCVSRDGKVVVLAAAPQFKVLATNQLEERGQFNASFAASGDSLYVRSNRFLYRIRALQK